MAPPRRAKSRRTVRLAIEVLEDRIVPTVNDWINSAGGSWNVPANWSTGAVPTSTDDVVINLAGSVTVDLPSGAASVHSLQCANSLVINGGTLTSAGEVQVTGSLSVTAGGLTAASGTYSIVIGGTFSYSGGAISGEFISLNSTIDVASTVTSTSTIEVRGAGNTLVENASPAVTLEVQGEVWDGNAELTASNGATNAGMIQLTSLTSGSYNSDLALAGSLTNTGAIESYAGTGGQRHVYGGTLHNQGMIDNEDGSALYFVGGSSGAPTLSGEAGTIKAGTNAYVIVIGGTFDYSGGAITGEFISLNSTLSVSSTVTATATIEVRGASNTLIQNAGANVMLAVQGETWDGNAELTASNGATNAGTIELTSLTSGSYNSDLALAGSLTNTGTIECFTGTGGQRHVYGGTLHNQGMIDNEDGSALYFVGGSSGAPTLSGEAGTIKAGTNAYVIVIGGTFDYSGGAITGEFIALNSALSVASTVTATANIEVRGAGNTLLQNASPSVTLTVQGEVWDGNAQLTAVTGAVNAGVIDLTSLTNGAWNSVLTIVGTLTNTGTIATLAGTGGSRHLYGGTLQNQGTISAAASVPLPFDVSATASPVLDQQSGTLSMGSGAYMLVGAGSFNYTGGTITGEFIALNSSVNVAPSVTATATIEVRGPNSTLVQNASPSVTLGVQGEVWDGNAQLTAANGAVNAGVIQLTAITTGGSWSSDVALAGTFTNTGTIVAYAGTGGLRQLLGGTLNNQGTIDDEDAGALYLSAGSSGAPTLNQESGTVIAGTAAYVIVIGGTLNYTGGTLTGEFMALNCSLNVAATVTSTETIEVRGTGNTLVQNASTAVTLEVEGEQWDHDALLTAVDGASNAGTIELQSITTSGWNSNLTLDGTLTNTGIIVTYVGSGGSRNIDGGTLQNEGTLDFDVNTNVGSILQNHGTIFVGAVAQLYIGAANNRSYFEQDAGSMTVDGTVWVEGGQFQLLGGTVSGSGTITVHNTSVNIGAGVDTVTTIAVVGAGNVLENNASSSITLLVQGTDTYQEGVITAASGAMNAGTIRLQSASSKWGQKLVTQDSMRNTGTIASAVGGGGLPEIDGSLNNIGTLEVDSGTYLQMAGTEGAGPTLTNSGNIQANGPVLLEGGTFNFTGGSVSGSLYADGGNVNVGASVTTPSTINVVGAGTVNNASAAVTIATKSASDIAAIRGPIVLSVDRTEIEKWRNGHVHRQLDARAPRTWRLLPYRRQFWRRNVSGDAGVRQRRRMEGIPQIPRGEPPIAAAAKNVGCRCLRALSLLESCVHQRAAGDEAARDHRAGARGPCNGRFC